MTGVIYYMGAFETPLFLYVLLHIPYEIIFYIFQSQSVHINHLKLLYGDIKIVWEINLITKFICNLNRQTIFIKWYNIWRIKIAFNKWGVKTVITQRITIFLENIIDYLVKAT